MNGHTFRESNFAIFTFSQHEIIFHMEPPRVRGTRVLLNDLGHMTKRATTSIYGKVFF